MIRTVRGPPNLGCKTSSGWRYDNGNDVFTGYRKGLAKKDEEFEIRTN